MTRSIRKWSNDVDATLQDCFASTDWNIFRDSPMALRNTVIGFINKGIDDIRRIDDPDPSCDASLPDEVYAFYAHFEASSTEACTRAPAVLDDCVITLSGANMNKTFKQVNIHKATGPDRLPGHVLKACADQLSSIFTDIFNLSLTESVIPTCFKQTTIVPVPKEAKATCLTDYCPVALTLVAMKCFERLVMAHINSILPDTLDPLQFAYRPN